MTQAAYKQALSDATIVLLIATMLHSIAVGNMRPSTAKVVAVDTNLAAVTELLDRGSGQAVGVVSDIGAFLPLLVQHLQMLAAN